MAVLLALSRGLTVIPARCLLRSRLEKKRNSLHEPIFSTEADLHHVQCLDFLSFRTFFHKIPMRLHDEQNQLPILGLLTVSPSSALALPGFMPSA